MNREYSAPLLPHLFPNKGVAKLRGPLRAGKRPVSPDPAEDLDEWCRLHSVRGDQRGVDTAQLPSIQEDENNLRQKAEKLRRTLNSNQELRRKVRVKLLGVQRELTATGQHLNCLAGKQALVKANTNPKLLRTHQELANYQARNALLEQDFTVKASQLQTLYSGLCTERDTLSSDITRLDSTAQSLKNELAVAQATLLAHYRRVLKEGTDTRAAGLAWVVQALWALNHSVSTSDFPSFLDEASAGSIVFIAEKRRQIEGFKASLLDSGISKLKRESLTTRDLLSAVKNRLSEAANRRPGRKRLGAIRRASISRSPQMSVALAMKRSIAEQESAIRIRVQSEIERLTTEFTLHQYGKLNEAISAVGGVGTLERYSSYITRLRLSLELKLANARTFTFHSKNNFK